MYTRIASMFVAGVSLASVASTAHADILEVGWAAVLAEPPSNIALNQWESDTEIRGFFERQTVLFSDLALDHVNTGLVDHESLVVPGLVSAGTAVQSYLFHADSVAGFDDLLSGYVVFDQPILGVLIHTASMNGTDDFPGRPGVTYGNSPGRRLELPPRSLDTFEISGNRTRLDFTLKFGPAYDEIRIVTAVPEPGCADVASLKARCKSGEVKVKLRLVNALFDGQRVRIRIGETEHATRVRGDRAKVRSDSGDSGRVPVSLVEPDCPEFDRTARCRE